MKIISAALTSLAVFSTTGLIGRFPAVSAQEAQNVETTAGNDNVEREQVCVPGDETCIATGQQIPEVHEASIDIDTKTSGINVHTKKAKEENIESYDDDDDYDDFDSARVLASNYYDDDDDDDEYEPEPSGDVECRDEEELCSFWAREGECQNNPVYMLKSCAKSCDSCKLNSDKQGFGSAYGVAQECEGDQALELIRAVEKMDRYMSEEVSKPEYDSVRSECKNRHELCVFWAHIGECEANPSFMLLQCAPACETCKNIDYEYRCPKDPSRKDIFGPGDLHKMFERIAGEYENATVLSQPPKEADAKFQPWVSIMYFY
jgi:ShK domain-like.